MRKSFIFATLTLLSLPIIGFAGTQNICEVLKVHPSWYQDAKVVQQKWGVPVSVQLAIIQEESHFKPDAKNKDSSAYGFAQAVNQIWVTYKENCDNKKQKRNNFKDATNFIGWYANRMQKQVNVSPQNAYQLYLSYHDGASGYLTALHKKQAFSKQLADHVQDVANQYKVELLSC